MQIIPSTTSTRKKRLDPVLQGAQKTRRGAQAHARSSQTMVFATDHYFGQAGKQLVIPRPLLLEARRSSLAVPSTGKPRMRHCKLSIGIRWSLPGPRARPQKLTLGHAAPGFSV